MNKLIAAMQNNDEFENVSDALNEMTLYARTHFKAEENYMMSFEYPGYQTQRRT